MAKKCLDEWDKPLTKDDKNKLAQDLHDVLIAVDRTTAAYVKSNSSELNLNLIDLDKQYEKNFKSLQAVLDLLNE